MKEKTLEEIEEKFPIGKKVKYYPIKGVNEFTETFVKSEPWNVCGSIVIKVEGVRCGVDVKHFEVVK